MTQASSAIVLRTRENLAGISDNYGLSIYIDDVLVGASSETTADHTNFDEVRAYAKKKDEEVLFLSSPEDKEAVVAAVRKEMAQYLQDVTFYCESNFFSE